MPEFPCSLRQAAKRLGVGRNIVRRIVRKHNISTGPSPLNGKAKMLDAAAFAELADLAEKHQPAAAG